MVEAFLLRTVVGCPLLMVAGHPPHTEGVCRRHMVAACLQLMEVVYPRLMAEDYLQPMEGASQQRTVVVYLLRTVADYLLRQAVVYRPLPRMSTTVTFHHDQFIYES